jgi:hypothetical protein
MLLLSYSCSFLILRELELINYDVIARTARMETLRRLSRGF